MATTVWPPIPKDELVREEDAAVARELEWLLSSLRTTLKSLKSGLEDCAALLAPTEHGSTLVVSTIFDPPLPPEVSVHLYLQDAGIILEIRTLEPWTGDDGSIFGFRKAIAGALGVSHAPLHDEAEKVFTYREQEVKVKEKIKVETQDPNLISAMAKLNALEHHVALSRKALDIVMGKNDDDER
ncbi:hypothetical protein UCDDS831_g02144 [Diplodia seriata]|uniref:37s ribosomal protein rsm22 n=1 Tax=Diplodia seriata TaxID=420778 RepID=A0A0G2ER23_9PEZI|nr:hypothetical protein UCDDS831_g02144 [Diplodia seriata]